MKIFISTSKESSTEKNLKAQKAKLAPVVKATVKAFEGIAGRVGRIERDTKENSLGSVVLFEYITTKVKTAQATYVVQTYWYIRKGIAIKSVTFITSKSGDFKRRVPLESNTSPADIVLYVNKAIADYDLKLSKGK